MFSFNFSCFSLFKVKTCEKRSSQYKLNIASSLVHQLQLMCETYGRIFKMFILIKNYRFFFGRTDVFLLYNVRRIEEMMSLCRQITLQKLVNFQTDWTSFLRLKMCEQFYGFLWKRIIGCVIFLWFFMDFCLGWNLQKKCWKKTHLP